MTEADKLTKSAKDLVVQKAVPCGQMPTWITTEHFIEREEERLYGTIWQGYVWKATQDPSSEWQCEHENKSDPQNHMLLCKVKLDNTLVVVLKADTDSKVIKLLTVYLKGTDDARKAVEQEEKNRMARTGPPRRRGGS
ncbi:unnamed protein product [Amoebophrya sp. A25]|nr:unnamed protein product [Amoebophrya sp. A25]|eukprot:GSA25T00004212001.1